MSFINKYLRNFVPYKLASHKIWGVTKERRKEILKLDWNEASIPPSPQVTKRINKLVEDGEFYNLYPATLNEELLHLLSEYVQLPEENIQYFGGSDSLHEYIAKTYISVGDPVLIVWPSYDNFRLTAEVNGASVYFTPVNDDFSMNEDLIVNAIKEIEPSLVYLCNPNNPTGNIHSVEFIESMLKEFSNVVFLVDEAYAEFSGVTVKDLVTQYENLLVSRTMSKAFGIANFRFGYLLASEANIKYISTIRNPKNITTFAQEAAAGALSDVQYMLDYVEEVTLAREYFEEQLQNLCEYLQTYESHGNFIMIKCLQADIKDKLLTHMEENDIFIRKLSQSDSLKDCVRITIGNRQQMQRVYSVMVSFFEGWNKE